MKILLCSSLNSATTGGNIASRFAETVRNKNLELQEAGEKHLFVLFDNLFSGTNVTDLSIFYNDYFHNAPLLLNFGFDDLLQLAQRKTPLNKFIKGLKNQENVPLYLDRSTLIGDSTYLLPFENTPDCLGLQIGDDRSLGANNFIWPSMNFYSLIRNQENKFKSEEEMARLRELKAKEAAKGKKDNKKEEDLKEKEKEILDPSILGKINQKARQVKNSISSSKYNPYDNSAYDRAIQEAEMQIRLNKNGNIPTFPEYKSDFSLKELFSGYTKKAIKAAAEIKSELEKIHYHDSNVKNIIVLNTIPGSPDSLEHPEKQDTMSDSNLGLFVNRFVFPEIEEIAAAHPETKYIFVSSSVSKNNIREIYPNVVEMLFTSFNTNDKGQQNLSLHTLEV